MFWGSYHGYFADLDGYYWEVAWGPNFKYDDNGMLVFNMQILTHPKIQCRNKLLIK
ncbi:hypothetical protein CSC2_38130 [Clostridium zeae]|uniref:Uncharacterized protein n=1 Tax=Clostridium zeae TaxID=2759022 RepID=A0ABQ1EEP2_9CLOT|nr:hypothetical protein CSC2_38130 [Clostridium zeae]